METSGSASIAGAAEEEELVRTRGSKSVVEGPSANGQSLG
jgi:hypothetical protein